MPGLVQVGVLFDGGFPARSRRKNHLCAHAEDVRPGLVVVIAFVGNDRHGVPSRKQNGRLAKIPVRN